MLDGIPGLTSGKLEKMVIEAFQDAERSRPIQSPNRFEFMFNPNSFSEKYVIQYSDRQPVGTAGEEKKFNRTPPKQYTFDILLDGTGASSPSFDIGLGVALPGIDAILEPPNVAEMVETFLKVAYEYQGDAHRTPYLTIVWGQALGHKTPRSVLDCVLLSADVNYTLFRNDGAPLRAKIKAVFEESLSGVERVRLMDQQSPDLSHIREVEEGQSLPLLSHSEYDDPYHYLQLAKVNRIKHFRRLKAGQELRFPPLRYRSEVSEQENAEYKSARKRMTLPQTIPGATTKDTPTYTVKVNGREVNKVYELQSIIVIRQVNRVSTAELVYYDGDPSDQDFSISASDDFLPGNTVEVFAGV